jgi:hypothetical protein
VSGNFNFDIDDNRVKRRIVRRGQRPRRSIENHDNGMERDFMF